VVLSPIDLIPEFLPVIGRTNDSMRRSYLSRPGLAVGDRWVERFVGDFVLGIGQ
jgi:Protein of unknown function (DUF1232)